MQPMKDTRNVKERNKRDSAQTNENNITRNSTQANEENILNNLAHASEMNKGNNSIEKTETSKAYNSAINNNYVSIIGNIQVISQPIEGPFSFPITPLVDGAEVLASLTAAISMPRVITGITTARTAFFKTQPGQPGAICKNVAFCPTGNTNLNSCQLDKPGGISDKGEFCPNSLERDDSKYCPSNQSCLNVCTIHSGSRLNFNAEFHDDKTCLRQPRHELAFKGT